MQSDTKSGVSSGYSSEPPTTDRQNVHGIYRLEGEFWTVAYNGHVVHIRDTKGLGYIAHLLRHPNIEFHALDLSAGIGAANLSADDERHRASTLDLREEELERAGLRRGIPEDAGEMLDDEAKASYKRRLVELRELVDDAREIGNAESAAELADEIDSLTRELARAVGLGGRDRRAGSVSERARLNATRAIRSAIERITENDAAIGELLGHTIKTGTFCSYNPSTKAPVEWEFGAPSIDLVLPHESLGAIESERDKAGIADCDTWPPPSPLLERTAFVGRTSERRDIDAAVDHAFHGSGAITLLGGGAGVGKTRLAIECARDAALRGALVLIGHCYESEEPHPYLPFVEMLEGALEQARSREVFRNALGENAPELAQLMPRLRRLFPDIPPAPELPAEQARRYLFESLCDFLARSAKARPVLLILDDVHWADESTFSLLAHISRRVAAMPVAVIATYRDGEPNRRANIVKFLEDLLRTGVRQVRLKGLDRDAVAAMLSAMSGREPPPSLIHAMCEETQGNPFFVEELYKHLVEEGRVFDSAGKFLPELKISEQDVPANVRLIVRRRLDRMSAATCQALASAAVMGRSFSFKLLESVAEADSDALLDAIDESLRMGFIVSTSEGPEAPFNFAHELVRQSLLSELSPPRRQKLHSLVAQSLQQAYATSLEDRSAEIAHHLSLAGNEADARDLARFLRMAGEQAMQAAAYEDALGHFEQALKHRPTAESVDTANLLYEIGMAKRSLGRWEDALSDWRRSLDVFKSLGDRAAAGRVTAAIVEALAWAGRYMDAAQIAYRGLAVLEGSRTADRARLLAAIGMINTASGAFQPANEALTEAQEVAEQVGDERTLGTVLSYRAFEGYAFLRLGQAMADGLRSAKLLRSNGMLWSLAQLLGFLQSAMLYAGTIPEACAIGDELGPLAAKIGHSAATMLSGRVRAWIEFGRSGNLATLSAALNDDLDIVTAAKLPWKMGSYAQLAVADFYRGDWAAALEHSHQGYVAEFPSAFDGYATGTLIRQRAYSGDRDGVLAIHNQSQPRFPRLGFPMTIGSGALLVLSIEALFVIREWTRAADLYPLAAELAGTETKCLAEISRFPHTAAAIAAAAGKRWDLAEDHFRISLKLAEEFPHQLEQLEIKRFHGEMLLNRSYRGDHAKAGDLLSSAIQGYERLGMPEHLAITRSLVARM